MLFIFLLYTFVEIKTESKMKASVLASGLLFYLERSRRIGTTTLLKKIASENSVIVLVPFEQDKKEFGESAVSFDELCRDSILLEERKPLLIDNRSLILFCRSFIEELRSAYREKNERDALIASIENSIEKFRILNSDKK